MKIKYLSFLLIIFVFTLSTYSVVATTAPSYTFNSAVQCSTSSETLYITGGPGDVYNVSSLKAPTNTCVKITFHDGGVISHTFSIKADSANNVTYFNIYDTAGITNSSNFWTGNANATYTYFCQVPGHEQAGMKGNFIVGSGGSGSSKSSPGFSLLPLTLGLFVIYGVTRFAKKKRNM